MTEENDIILPEIETTYRQLLCVQTQGWSLKDRMMLNTCFFVYHFIWKYN